MEKRFEEKEEPVVERSRGGLPRAKVKKGWRISPVWLVPLIAGAFLGWLLYRTFIEAGPKITIRFKEGKGVEQGKTPLKYRGVKVGDVTRLKLSEDQKYVEVQVQLDHSAAGLAREGTLFWIVHPEVSMSGIRGLNTIVSGDYIQVQPGHGARTNEFNGLEQEPVVQFGSAKALRLVLLTGQLRSISPGTAVLYRGIKVGETTKNELSADAQAVAIHVYIYPQFATLVRKNSKFWNAGGVNMNVGLFGADITAHSMQTLITGALAFATPNNPEGPAPDGTAFRLYDKAQEEWLNWAPALKLPPARTNLVEGQTP